MNEPCRQRVIITRTLEHGTTDLASISWSPSRGHWDAAILIDGDARLTSVPLSELEPEYASPAAHPFRTPDGNKIYCKTCGCTREAGNHTKEGT